MKTELNQILVVDDDPDIATMIRIMLEYKGFSVTIAPKPADAKKIADEGNRKPPRWHRLTQSR